VARDLAATLAAGPTVAYGAIKSALNYSADHDLASSLEHEAELQDRCARTEDHAAATEAFVAKQRPIYKGR
jgi:2-(1,2-epoxy-1,2-dihydrophenyl)acetyl-CoA isomerase